MIDNNGLKNIKVTNDACDTFAVTSANAKNLVTILAGLEPDAKWKNWETNLSSGVVSFRIYPLNMKIRCPVGAVSNITFMGKDSGISGYHIGSSGNTFIVEMGATTVPTANGFLDYEPFTKYRIYLPFVGWYNLDAALITNKLISVKYLIDINTGGCTAYIVDSSSEVLYRFQGVIGTDVPYSSTSKVNVSKYFIQNGTQYLNNALDAGFDMAMGGYKYSKSQSQSQTIGGIEQFAGGAVNLLKGTNSFIANTFASPQVIGSLGGNAGDLTSFAEGYNCFIVIDRCVPIESVGYNHLAGRPLMKVKKIGDMTGYTEVSSMHTDGIDATAPELDMIVSTMQEGVIL